MADVAEAIAAALGAATAMAAPPSNLEMAPQGWESMVPNELLWPGPEIKHEPLNSDAMVLDSEPTRSSPPPSPRKRSRSPHEYNQDQHQGQDGEMDNREEKRLKMEPEVDDGMDEIARLVQQAEASVLQQIQSAPETSDQVPSFTRPETTPGTDPAREREREPEAEAEAEAESNTGPDQKHEPQAQASSEIDHMNGVLDSAEHDDFEAALEAALEQARTSPVEDIQSRPDSIWSNPRDYTRRKHLIPALGSMAIDILVTLSEQSLEDTVATLGGDLESDISREYASLRAAFDVQKRQLAESETTHLLDADALSVTGQAKEIIRIANLASTCASIFGTNEVTLEEINNQFLRIFVPENEELSREAAELYLGLKTQLFLALLEAEHDKARDHYLDEIFSVGVESSLLQHHPNVPLVSSELDFIAQAKTRKAMLLDETKNPDGIHTVGRKFTYEAFLDNLSVYLNDHMDNIRSQGSGKVETKPRQDTPAPEENGHNDFDGAFDLDAAIAEASKAAQSALETGGEASLGFDDLSAFLSENITKATEQASKVSAETELPSTVASAAENASKATMLALQNLQHNQYQPTAMSQSNSQSHSNSTHNYAQQPQSQQLYYQYQQQPAASMQSNYQAGSNGLLPPNQSDSTPALYERARQAAAARSSTHARREGSHSTRRPWSPDEEKALMLGLDMVKGPHWSQILSLFGPNGSVSQILADRTQVQLKDKARNLKLFFLKTNSEMPYYLQCVTGELKTRAPTQAARKEAEEKARMNSEEHQAHMNGILTLAGGLQKNSASASTPSTAVGRSNTPNQPMSHHGSQPGTPRLLQQGSSLPMTATPRPVIPAPQPVSLPNLTSTSHYNKSSSTVTQPAVKQESSPSQRQEQSQAQQQTYSQSPAPTPAQGPPSSAPEVQSSVPDHGGLSLEDAALLDLKAAMEGESAASAAANQTNQPGQAQTLAQNT
ncbi:telomere repeat binding factor-domain-containing protein [Xylariomycetidae sp. FL0641]|nr:telomere repeat binding factor-domain-containing protein [Xylariomycetidae sp. FL0641]